MRLLRTEDYPTITIQQIVDEAGVSRMAFYRNFDSKDAIVQYFLQAETDAFVLRTDHHNLIHDPERYLLNLMRHLSEKREIGLLVYRTGLFDLMRAEFDRAYDWRMETPAQQTLFHIIAGGLCNVYYHWLANGCQETAEELTAQIMDGLRLLERGVST